jgi:hypothetical protein
MEPFVGSILFEVIGEFFRWLHYSILARVKRRKQISFREVLRGKKGLKDLDRMLYGVSNIGLGMIVVLVLLVLLVWIDFD